MVFSFEPKKKMKGLAGFVFEPGKEGFKD